MIRRIFKRRFAFGYLAGVFVASLYFVLAIVLNSHGGPEPRDFPPDEELQPAIVPLLVLTFGVLFALTVVPSIVFVIAAEAKAVKGAAPYILFALILEFGLLSLPILLFSLEIDPEDLVAVLALLPAGVISGIVYWWISGRYAGDDIRNLKKQIEVFDRSSLPSPPAGTNALIT
ncbi:MAG: hypothetical protein JJ979_12715 [Roseibium sp.]|nr:hypothetical protein [Roseibium sp.]